jgi:peptide subunit release factor 1 (eRF1)
MAEITMADVQPLLQQFSGEGLLVSCYADLSGPEGFMARWEEHLKAEGDRVKAMLADDHRAWRQCERDLAAIRRVIGPAVSQGARGMAVFSASQRDFFRSFPLEVPVENQVVVHGSPYLVPLLEVFCRQHDDLVVHTDTHRGRLFAARTGALRLLHEIQEDVPRKQHSVGERWGKEQATIARHREDRIQHYHADLANLVEKTWADHPFQGLILLGEHEVVEHFRKRLPPRLEAQVVLEAPQAWTEEPLAIQDKVQAAVAEVERTREGRLLGRLNDLLREGGAVAKGPQAVVEALQGGRLGPHGHGYLLAGRDPREAAGKCTSCRTLWVDMPSTCPRCQFPCVSANLWEEVLLLALRRDITVHCVKADVPLAAHGGMVAVLPASVPAGKEDKGTR